MFEYDSDDEAAQHEAARIAAKLQTLGLTLASRRTEAITAREQSGIEREWVEDDEHYQGVDDANRHENGAYRTKPPGQVQARAVSATRSTVFVNITRPYCDAAAARIADMLLPTDDRAWSIGPTPIPDLANIAQGQIPDAMRRQVERMMSQRGPGALGQPPDSLGDAAAMAVPQVLPPTLDAGAAVAPPETQQASVDDYLAQASAAAKKLIDDATKAAEAAQKRIEDWHVECQFHAEVRKGIEDAARIGTCVVKGPIPVKKKSVAYLEQALVIQESIQPATKRIDVWNLFPDGSCGENIHHGAYIWERDYMTARQVRDLIGLPGYIESQIRAVLEEGPQTAVSNPKYEPKLAPADDKRYEIWYYHGDLDHEDLKAAGCECRDHDAIPAVVTMINNRVIRATLNPLDSGEFPYDVMPWQRRSGHWAGIGVARQIRSAQRIVNAGTRTMMDNAGLASGPMLVFRQGVVTPANNVVEIAPRKIWMLAQDADEKIAAERAIGVIKVEMLVQDLLLIIQFGLQRAEDVTGLPMLLQGQQGKAPDTLGGMQMMNNNASTVLRRLARLFDDCITEPHVRRYYAWLLQYGEDDSEKGDFSIDARGSSALVERDLQNQAIMQMGALVKDPAFEISPSRWFDEWCKANRLDPKRLKLTDAEKQELAQKPQQPPLEMAIAQLRADVELQKVQIQTQAAVRKMEVDTDRDKALVESQIRRDQTDYEARMAELQVKREIEILKYSTQQKISLNQAKVQLAKTTMTLRTQRELSAADRAMQVATPIAEPPGRARPGHAFQE